MIRNEARDWWRRESVAGRSGQSGASVDQRLGTPGSGPAFWSMVTFTGILLLAPQAYFPALAPLRLAFWAAVIAVVAYVADRLARGVPIIVMSRELRVAACLAGWALLTVPLSLWPGGSLQRLQDGYLKSLVIFYLLSNLVDSVPRLRQTCWALALLSVPLAATGITQYVQGIFLNPGGAVERIEGYSAPLTSNPNDLALMLNLILPLTIALFFFERGGGRRLLLAGTIALSVIAVVVTFSRGGFVTLASITCMYLWKLRKRPERHWVYACLVLTVICIPLLPGGYLHRIETVTDTSKDVTGSSEARWIDSVAALRVVLKHPVVGAGIGGNILALNTERGDNWHAVHNAYLEYAVDLGLPGLALFLLLLFGCIRRVGELLRRTGRAGETARLAYLAEGVQASLYAFAVAALFHPVAYHFYFYYLAGLAVGVSRVGGMSAEPEPGPSARARA